MDISSQSLADYAALLTRCPISALPLCRTPRACAHMRALITTYHHLFTSFSYLADNYERCKRVNYKPFIIYDGGRRTCANTL